MQYILSAHLNAVSEEREQEFSNWYNYVHLRDVLNLDGHIAAQRFVRDQVQPEGYDQTYRYYTIYEIRDIRQSILQHQKCTMSWRMMVSTAMDLRNYKGGYWEGVHSSVPYAAYAEFGAESHLMVTLLKPTDGFDVRDVFTRQVVQQIGSLPGVYAANLFRYSDDQLKKKTARPERYTHQLLIQWQDVRLGTDALMAFLAKLPEKDRVEMAATNYVSLQPRLKQIDNLRSEQDRALSALYHMVCSMPGYFMDAPGMSMDYTDVLTPVIKEKL